MVLYITTKYRLLHNQKDKECMIKIKINSMITEIQSIIVNQKEDIKSFYKINHQNIEISVSKWIDLLIEILYEINLIKRINEIAMYINDKKQNYFILSTDFLKYIIEQEYMFEIIQPTIISSTERISGSKSRNNGWLL